MSYMFQCQQQYLTSERMLKTKFLTTFRRFPARNRKFEEITEGFQRLKIAEDFRGRPEDVSIVFSVTLIQNRCPESEKRKKVMMQKHSPRFRWQQFFLYKMCGETFFPEFTAEICIETPCWVAAENQQKHLSLSFATKVWGTQKQLSIKYFF